MIAKRPPGAGRDVRQKRTLLAQIWSHRGYRSVLISLVMSGVSVSSYVPLVSLFLVQTLRVGDASVGLFTLTFLASPVVGVIAGKLSDRLSSRFPLLAVVLIWLALGRLAMGLAPTFSAAIAVGIVFGAFVAIPNAQIFALLRELLEQEGEPRQATIAISLRSGYALGWAIGPLLGTFLAAVLGYRSALAATGLFVLLPLLPLLPLRRLRLRHLDRKSTSDDAEAIQLSIRQSDRYRRSPKPIESRTRSLWVFAVVCLLALTGEAVRLSYLPVLAVDRLGIPLWVFGVILSVAPLLELVIMPVTGSLADKVGLKRVIFAGLLIGAGGFVAFAFSTSVFGLLIGQLCNACFTAILLGLGITYAQRLHPAGAGFAASVFFAAQSLSPVPAGILGNTLASQFGLTSLFLIPALLCTAGAVLLLLIREEHLPTRHSETPTG